jgi:hypothetical protein
LPHPERLAPPTTDESVRQIAEDIRMTRNIGLAFLLGRMVPGLFALVFIWLLFFRH